LASEAAVASSTRDIDLLAGSGLWRGRYDSELAAC
jgi:hypothetical protein